MEMVSRREQLFKSVMVTGRNRRTNLQCCPSSAPMGSSCRYNRATTRRIRVDPTDACPYRPSNLVSVLSSGVGFCDRRIDAVLATVNVRYRDPIVPCTDTGNRINGSAGGPEITVWRRPSLPANRHTPPLVAPLQSIFVPPGVVVKSLKLATRATVRQSKRYCQPYNRWRLPRSQCTIRQSNVSAVLPASPFDQLMVGGVPPGRGKGCRAVTAAETAHYRQGGAKIQAGETAVPVP